ncbi:GTP cyclohydrolase II [Candidatus Profftella armatura (Diaphorina cf. continua)]|uniref:GTP cyclohydrolase-2 n=1 Tax=Candidatus Profftella armatura (Diaphorina cf. continua) TaxID=2661583 RepID=A0A7R7ABU4_9PROT|nr:GTP cyclohydrolase II [Candidatus Profftella armatura (Diaphorina cf. continua)]BCG49741.1 GTP cyclohydrolase II [Candidatus Profftella armatura (Diaphorina cf. continua)]
MSYDEETLKYITTCNLPTPWATFQLHAFVDTTGKEHLAITLGVLNNFETILIRIHSECLTGDAMFSQRCDCGAQLETALKKIALENKGVLFYLRQEGRGIGLINKLRAYKLQDEGADTVEANQKLGFADDQRNYKNLKSMFDHFGINKVRLMTNNPNKVAALKEFGVTVVERISILVNRNPFNNHYLNTKAKKLGHFIMTHKNKNFS